MSRSDGATGARLFVDALSRYDVPYVFGNPGTTELPIIEAIASKNGCEYVMALHEDIAVGMAAGYAKTRLYHSHADGNVNPLGVVNLHAAPGLAHGLGNVHGSSYSGAPLLVTAGIQSRGFQHEEPILSGDLVEMAEQFTKWSAMVNDIDALPGMVRRAVRTALTPPMGPVFLGFPLDVLTAETAVETEPLGAIPTAGRGDREQIWTAAEILADAEEPVMVVGDGIARSGRRAVESAVELAETGGLRVHGEILAAEVNYPGTNDLWHSFLPPNADVARQHMDTDTILFVGCSTNTTVTAHDEPLVPTEATCIHVSDDAWQVGKNTPADAAIVGDPGAVMEELAGHLEELLTAEERENRIERASEYRSTTATDTPPESDQPIASKPEFVDHVREVAPDAFLVDESITTKYVLLDRWPLEAEQFLSTKGGGLGYGLPAAVGAALAEDLRPDARNVIATIGDGSFLYYPQSLYTAARYSIDLTVIIPDNRSYTVLKENTVDMLGGETDDYDFDGMGIDLQPNVNFPTMAESQGVDQRDVSDPEEIQPVVGTAIEEPGPSLIDVHIHD